MNPQRLEAIAASIRFADPTAKVSVAIVVETQHHILECGKLLEFINVTAEKEGLTVDWKDHDYIVVLKNKGGKP